MNSEQFMDLLEHADFYDPVKAHEYYLRTRQLKGRRPGAQMQPNSSPRNGSNGSTAPQKRQPARNPQRPNRQQLQSQADQRTDALKVRIARLKAVLERLVAEAKQRSGVKTPQKKDAHKTPESQKKPAAKQPHHHLTQKEKEAKKKYDEQHKKPAHQKPPQEKTDQELKDEIDQLRGKIEAVRQQLKAAVKNARPQPDGSPNPQRPRPKSRS
jgi:hypothetical protein